MQPHTTQKYTHTQHSNPLANSEHRGGGNGKQNGGVGGSIYYITHLAKISNPGGGSGRSAVMEEEEKIARQRSKQAGKRQAAGQSGQAAGRQAGSRAIRAIRHAWRKERILCATACWTSFLGWTSLAGLIHKIVVQKYLCSRKPA